ncbi:MAG: hypothetical protein Sylvanvirus11_25 [Sylvanvirus sp.]|uniref:RING-type domain-containing protein n=1 Tax=Sylvanvirus sp. TaxID=2487774 RepID=A0A3G5AI16_9VIRU|nr:MAG: hypothetical protein Sylvanvirus11_25 [Sylvanvirus sp.]
MSEQNIPPINDAQAYHQSNQSTSSNTDNNDNNNTTSTSTTKKPFNMLVKEDLEKGNCFLKCAKDGFDAVGKMDLSCIKEDADFDRLIQGQVNLLNADTIAKSLDHAFGLIGMIEKIDAFKQDSDQEEDEDINDEESTKEELATYSEQSGDSEDSRQSKHSNHPGDSKDQSTNPSTKTESLPYIDKLKASLPSQFSTFLDQVMPDMETKMNAMMTDTLKNKMLASAEISNLSLEKADLSQLKTFATEILQFDEFKEILKSTLPDITKSILRMFKSNQENQNQSDQSNQANQSSQSNPSGQPSTGVSSHPPCLEDCTILEYICERHWELQSDLSAQITDLYTCILCRGERKGMWIDEEEEEENEGDDLKATTFQCLQISPCNHIFDQQCLTSWRTTHTGCPQCIQNAQNTPGVD